MDPGWKEFRHQVDWRRGDDGQFEWSLDQKAVEEEKWRNDRRGYGWGGGRTGDGEVERVVEGVVDGEVERVVDGEVDGEVEVDGKTARIEEVRR